MLYAILSLFSKLTGISSNIEDKKSLANVRFINLPLTCKIIELTEINGFKFNGREINDVITDHISHL